MCGHASRWRHALWGRTRIRGPAFFRTAFLRPTLRATLLRPSHFPAHSKATHIVGSHLIARGQAAHIVASDCAAPDGTAYGAHAFRRPGWGAALRAAEYRANRFHTIIGGNGAAHCHAHKPSCSCVCAGGDTFWRGSCATQPVFRQPTRAGARDLPRPLRALSLPASS